MLDDDVDMRESMVDLFSLEGWPCLGVESFEDVVGHTDEVLGARLAILDVNLGAGRRSGVDVYRWLRGQRFPGRVVFLTGHAEQHPLVLEARSVSDTQVLTKPVSAERLLELASPRGAGSRS